MNALVDDSLSHVMQNASDELTRRCWKYQDCNGCLRESSCSWCPSSTSCIPNQNKIQILAPIWDADICPLWSERWELRTRPLGCHASTITFFTCIISVLSTFVVIGFVAIGVKATRQFKVLWANRGDKWWRFWEVKRPEWWIKWRADRAGLRRDVERTEDSPLLS